jgi:hypothetical protein
MGIDCRLDLGRGSGVPRSDERVGSFGGIAVPALTSDEDGE